jgi:hypothetical protein
MMKALFVKVFLSIGGINIAISCHIFYLAPYAKKPRSHKKNNYAKIDPKHY